MLKFKLNGVNVLNVHILLCTTLASEKLQVGIHNHKTIT